MLFESRIRENEKKLKKAIFDELGPFYIVSHSIFIFVMVTIGLYMDES